MAFTDKILSWRFRPLNIVGCFLKRRPTKGGSRAPQEPPRYAPGEWTEAASVMVFVPALTLSGYGVNIVCYTAVFSVVTQRSVGRSVA